jgi:prepilin peptidase CpaA
MFRIPNLLTLPLLLAGLVAHALAGGLPGLGASLIGAGFGFAALIVFYAAGGMGAGDVKFLAAVGAWLGLPLTFELFVASAFIAGFYAAVVVVASGRLRACFEACQLIWFRLASLDFSPAPVGLCVRTALAQPDRRRRVIPHAAMIAAGLVAVLVRHS